MNWFKENVFATVLLLITLLGTGALVFLGMQTAGKIAATNAEFETKKNEYQRLTGLPIFPSQENVTKLKEERDRYVSRADALKAEIAKIQLPLEKISPSQFQDKLAAATRDVLVKAAANNVTITDADKFFLGFEGYRTSLPREESVAELNVVLTSILDSVNKLIDSRVANIDKVIRVPLASEGGAAPATPAPNASKPASKNKPGEARKVLERITYSVSFNGGNNSVQNFLNIATDAPQLVTMQLVRLENEQTKGPARTAPAAPGEGGDPSGQPAADPNAAPGDPAANGAPAAPAPPPINFILGEEKVNASVRFQIIRVIADAPAKS